MTERQYQEFLERIRNYYREKIPKDFVKACEVLVQEKIDAVLAEREACAKVCETDELCCKCGDECAAAIRARGEK